MITKLHYAQRLLKLARHLERGKLIHEEFKFTTWNEAPWARKTKSKIPSCGFSGCALGECPGVFPGWTFGDGRVVGTTPTYRSKDGYDAAEIFFGLSPIESRMLFSGGGYRGYTRQPTELPARLVWDSTKEEVAANIRAFVKKKWGRE